MTISPIHTHLFISYGMDTDSQITTAPSLLDSGIAEVMNFDPVQA